MQSGVNIKRPQTLTRLKRAALAVIVLQTVACTTIPKYEGPLPNMSATGEEAKLEVEKFELEATFDRPFHVKSTGKVYQSFQPVIETVSPKAHEMMNRPSFLEYGMSMVLAGAAILFLGPNDKTGHKKQAYALLGTSLMTAGFFFPYILMQRNLEAAQQYNHDLHEQFVPVLGVQTKF